MDPENISKKIGIDKPPHKVKTAGICSSNDAFQGGLGLKNFGLLSLEIEIFGRGALCSVSKSEREY